ncbi:glycosyl hydrolase 108 family protein [Xenorhabdus nematophila]|uniref:glycosyl hydrolase 108 family protein n=1 Tax=Xenorhabdus nematophila TaxID=628 RepID=UPI002D21A2F8|nr:glycosyl hydrolase 108 family protein [Xenorhabdus nematophila]
MTHTYSVAFLHAINSLLPMEGGYVNDPHDRGGETQYGISQRSYPRLDIRALTQDDATAIYYRDFWLTAGCERVPRGFHWCCLTVPFSMGWCRPSGCCNARWPCGMTGFWALKLWQPLPSRYRMTCCTG